jgi:hypothetical protein
MFVSRQRATIDFALDNLVWLILLVVLVVFSITIPNYFQIGFCRYDGDWFVADYHCRKH